LSQFRLRLQNWPKLSIKIRSNSEAKKYGLKKNTSLFGWLSYGTTRTYRGCFFTVLFVFSEKKKYKTKKENKIFFYYLDKFGIGMGSVWPVISVAKSRSVRACEIFLSLRVKILCLRVTFLCACENFHTHAGLRIRVLVTRAHVAHFFSFFTDLIFFDTFY